MSAIPMVPAIDQEVAELAAWYAANREPLDDFSRRLWAIKRRLTEYVKDSGPIATPSGRVEIIPDGWDWDEASVALVMPALVSAMSVTLTGSKPDIERALSLISEDVPAVTIESTAIRIDKVSAARVVRSGGAAAQEIEACRSPRGKLGVR